MQNCHINFTNNSLLKCSLKPKITKKTTKFSACSLANKGSRTNLEVEVQNLICERSEQKYF